MTVKYVRTRNGKAWVQVGELNEDEWMEWLERTNANGVAKITSINPPDKSLARTRRKPNQGRKNSIKCKILE